MDKRDGWNGKFASREERQTHPLDELAEVRNSLWECSKCGFIYDKRYETDCINCNPPPTRS